MLPGKVLRSNFRRPAGRPLGNVDVEEWTEKADEDAKSLKDVMNVIEF